MPRTCVLVEKFKKSITHSYLDVFMVRDFFFAIWEGALGPSRLGKLVWLTPKLENLVQ